jgi:hypothetical protein
MPTLGIKQIVNVAPGVTPTTDNTNLDSITYVNGDKIRFQNGKLKKLGGCVRVFFTNNQRITGVAKSVFQYTISDNIVRVLIGTSTRLYCYQNSELYNITPLQTSSISIANSLSTIYKTDSAYSVTTTDETNLVTFNIPHFLNVGDMVTISGVTGTIGGISSTEFNDTFTVVQIQNSSSFQVLVTSTATSDDTGGGSSINFATSQIVIQRTSHGLRDGDRIKIAVATDVGGILAASINIENIVESVVSPNTFIINTDTIATSSVTAGGGGAAVLYRQLPYGSDGFSFGFGYGGGLYGEGLYGVPKEFTGGGTGNRIQIWSFDLFGESIILCPGGQNNVYIWDSDLSIAPTTLSGAPAAVDWVFESHAMVCVLNPDGDYGTMRSSNIGDATDWTPSASSTASIIIVPAANVFLSQGAGRDVDLLYTDFKVYQLRYDGFPFIWNVTELLTTDGIIGPKARVNIEDAVFWMGNGDFFVFDGTSIAILPNNTVKRYIFDNLNVAASYSCFAIAIPSYNEIFWFYPAGQDTEPKNYVIYNYKDSHWSIGTFERTAGLEPANAIISTLMIQSGLQTTLTLDADVFSTNYYVLGANPLTTTNASASVVANITGHKLLPGDNITIIGATTTNGITNADINGVRPIIGVTVNTVTFTAGASATSSGTGGGGAISVETQVITVTLENTFINNTYVTLENVAAFDNFSGSDINGTFPIRRFSTTDFDFIAGAHYGSAQISGGGDFATLTYDRTGRLFQHEVTNNDYDDNCDITNPDSCIKPLYSYAETNYVQFNDGNKNILMYSVIPDSTQQGTMQLTVQTKQYPQSSIETIKGPFSITENIDKIDVMALGRQRKYVISSNELDQDYIIGRWFEQIIETTPI